MPDPHKNSRTVRAYYPDETPTQIPIYMNRNTGANSSYPIIPNEIHAGNHQQYHYPYEMENSGNPQNNDLSQSFPHPQFHPLSMPPALSNYRPAPMLPQYSNNLAVHTQQTSPHEGQQIMENEVPHHLRSVPMGSNDRNSHPYSQQQPYNINVYNENTNNNNNNNNNNGLRMVPLPPDYLLREQQPDYGPNQHNHTNMDNNMFNNQARFFHNSPQFSMPPLIPPAIPPPHQPGAPFSPTAYEIHQPIIKPPSLFSSENNGTDMYPPLQRPAPMISHFSDISPQFSIPYLSQQQPSRKFPLQEKDERDNSQPIKNIFLPVITSNSNTTERSSVRSPEKYENVEPMVQSTVKVSSLPEMQTRFEFVKNIMPSFASQATSNFPQSPNNLLFFQNESLASLANLPKPIRLEFHNETSSQIASKSEENPKSRYLESDGFIKTSLKNDVPKQGANNLDSILQNGTEQRKRTKFGKLLNSELAEEKSSNVGRSKPNLHKKVTSGNRYNQNFDDLDPNEQFSNHGETEKNDKAFSIIVSKQSQESSMASQSIVRTSKLSSLLNDAGTSSSNFGVSNEKFSDNSASSAKKFRLSSLSSLLQSEPEANSVKVSKYPSIIGAIDSDDDAEYFNDKKNKVNRHHDKEDDDDDDDLTFGINDEEEVVKSDNIKEDITRTAGFKSSISHGMASMNYGNPESSMRDSKNISTEMLGGLNKDLSKNDKFRKSQFSFFNQTLAHGQILPSHLGPIKIDQNLKFSQLKNTQQEWRNFNLKNIKGSLNDTSPIIRKPNIENAINAPIPPVEKVVKRKGRPPKDVKAKQLKKEKDMLEKERRKAERDLKRKNKKELKNKLKTQKSISDNDLLVDSNSKLDINKQPESNQDMTIKCITDFLNKSHERNKSLNKRQLLHVRNQSDHVLLDLKSLNLSRISDVITQKKDGESYSLVSNEEAIAILEINNLAKQSMKEKKDYEDAIKIVNREYMNLAKFYNMSEERRIDHLESRHYTNKGIDEESEVKTNDSYETEVNEEYESHLSFSNEISKRVNVLEDKYYDLSNRSSQYNRLKEIRKEIQQILEEGNKSAFIDCNSDELRACELMRLRNAVKIQRNNNLDIFLGETVPLIEQSWNLLMSKVNNLESFLKFQKEMILRCNFDYDLQDSDKNEEGRFQKSKKEFLESLLTGYDSQTTDEESVTNENLKIQMNIDKERKRPFRSSDDEKLTMRKRNRRNNVGGSGGNSGDSSKDSNIVAEEKVDGGSLHRLNIFTLLDSEDDFHLVTNYNFENILQQITSSKSVHYSENKLMKLVRNYMQDMSKRKSSRHVVTEEKHVEQGGYRSTGGLSTRYYSTANNNSSEGDSGTNTTTVVAPSFGRGRPRKKVITNGDGSSQKGEHSSSGYYGGCAPPTSGGRGGRAKKDLQLYGLSNEDIEKDLAALWRADW